jgi:hypothetical protein
MRKYTLLCGGVLLSLLLPSCPLELPNGLQVIASPAVYLPLGGALLQDLDNLTFDLSGLANLGTGSFSGGGFDVRDYPGGYPDTMAFAAIVELVNTNIAPDTSGLPPPFTNIDLDNLPPGIPDSYPIPVPQINYTGSDLSINVSALMDPLEDYADLHFRSLNAYLYIDGPPSLFGGGNVKVTLKITPYNGTSAGTQKTLLNTAPVSNLRLPDLPASGPITEELRPRPSPIAMAPIFNARPTTELKFEYEIITVDGSTDVPLKELLEHRKITAYLVLVMPLEFVVFDNMAIVVDSAGSSPGNAIIDITDAGDLFGRSSGDSGELFDSMEYLALEAVVKNNLGLGGYVELNTGDPGTASATIPSPTALGRINLEGTSRVRISKTQMVVNPFQLWARVILEKGQNVDIKRQSTAATKPLEIHLGATLKTSINQRF